MFEYLKSELFISILIVMLLDFLFSDEPFSFIWMYMFLILLLFMDAYSDYSDAKSNINSFKKGNALVCFSGGGMYSSASKYKVSQDEGWELEDKRFVKDSFIVDVSRCKEE